MVRLGRLENLETDVKILLKHIWQIDGIENYKVHFGRWNGNVDPLDEWVNDRSKWQGWQEYRPDKNEFSRPYIFSLMDFYHEEDTWLFGGVFHVTARHDDRYEVELTKQGQHFIGRLKLEYQYLRRSTRVNFEKHYNKFRVSELLRATYSGQIFPGYEDIDLSYAELEIIIRNDRSDWKSALENVGGIYLITDERDGKRYVGSAYGEGGIWSRWKDYVDTSGHGGNTELRKLLKARGDGYARKYFQFALLEYRAASTPEETIIARENFWKDVLLTRDKKYGHNRN